MVMLNIQPSLGVSRHQVEVERRLLHFSMPCPSFQWRIEDANVVAGIGDAGGREQHTRKPGSPIPATALMWKQHELRVSAFLVSQAKA